MSKVDDGPLSDRQWAAVGCRCKADIEPMSKAYDGPMSAADVGPMM